MLIIKRVILCSKQFILCVLSSQASDRGEMLGFFGKRSVKRTWRNDYSYKNMILPVISICVLSNHLWFFQLVQFVRDIGTCRWTFLGVTLRDCVQDQKSKAKSCFVGPLLQPLVRDNFISSFPTINAAFGEEPLLTFYICIPKGVLTPSHPSPQKNWRQLYP